MKVSGAAGALRSVWFADAQHGWAVGTNTIVATADGGETWTAQKPPGSYNDLYGVTFVDAQHGWIVGGAEQIAPGTILATSDGGRTWRTQRSKGNVLFDVAFADKRRGWVVGTNGLILATEDGGRHWRTQRPGAEENLWLSDVVCIDTEHIWAVGSDAELRGVIVSSSDGGAHWTRRPVGPGGLLSVSFADASRGCVGDTDGRLFTTADGGATWTKHRIRYKYKDGSGSYPVDEVISAVSMTDASHITVVTGGGLVYVSADGGATWTERHGKCRVSAIYDAYFLSE